MLQPQSIWRRYGEDCCNCGKLYRNGKEYKHLLLLHSDSLDAVDIFDSNEHYPVDATLHYGQVGLSGVIHKMSHQHQLV